MTQILDDKGIGTPREDLEAPAPVHLPTWVEEVDHAPPLRKPAVKPDRGQAQNYPSSARVIPLFKGFENTKGASSPKEAAPKEAAPKEAALMADIEAITGDAVRGKSKDYTPKLLRVDRKRGFWNFQVGRWIVKVKATFKGRGTKFDKADLQLTCSCPFWRWQGPEHWALVDQYLLRKPRGTATFPIVRDPSQEKGTCKHAFAVLQLLKTYRLPRR